MRDVLQPGVVRVALGMLPSPVAAVVGFGCFLLSLEVNLLPAVRTISVHMQYPDRLVFLGLLACCAAIVATALAKGRIDAIDVPNGVVIALGAVLSVLLYLEWNQFPFLDGIPVSGICNPLFDLLCVILFFLWMKELHGKGPFAMACVFSLACFVVGVAGGFSALMRAEAAVGVLALAPCVSCACLYRFRRVSRFGGSAVSQGAGRSGSQKRAGLPEGVQDVECTAVAQDGKRWVLLALFCVAIFCFASVFGYVHTQWLAHQGGDFMSILMQMGIAVGTVLAGSFILLLVRYAWSYFMLNLYLFSTVPVAMLALWLTSFVSGSSIVLYLVLLNFAWNSVYFFICVLPSLGDDSRTSVWPWALVFLSFKEGQLATDCVMRFVDEPVVKAMSTGVVVLLFFCCGLIAYIGLNRHERLPEPCSTPPPAPAQLRGGLFRTACGELAAQYRLTEREGDALVLLARGRTAGHIAKTLVISQATAKVYIRSIYAKCGVHNQQDLISLVEDRIAELRDETDDRQADAAGVS